MKPPVIVAATIRYAADLYDLTFLLEGVGGSAVAELTFSDGSSEKFGWYHDELHYVSADFVGKTMEEVREMHRNDDIAYLRS